MKLTTLASGSSGNCHLLESEKGECLILDLGVTIKDLKVGIGFNLLKVVGSVVTHIHKDHAGCNEKAKLCGIKVFEPYKEFKKMVQFGEYKIYPFKVEHDVDCYGFLIIHPEGNLLYATDTSYVKYNFKKYNLKTIIIEANYDSCDLNKNEAKYKHVLTGHMSIDNAIKFVKANETDLLKNVLFCHLSQIYLRDDNFIDKAKKSLNRTIIRCEKGMEIIL